MTPEERAKWLAERRTGIGGSDVAGILGLSKWRSPYQVYLDKIGEGEEQEENEAMRWGTAMEPLILDRYAEVTGRVVDRPKGVFRSSSHPFQLATLDGFVKAEKRVVEAKTSKFGDGFGEAGTDEVPRHYLLQVQHYMMVTGAEVASVVALIGGSDFRIYEVPADKELQEMVLDAEAGFWQMVQTRTPPPPITFTDAIQRYGRCSALGAIVADEPVLKAVMELRAAKAFQKELDDKVEGAKAAVMLALGDKGDTLASPDGEVLVTWKLAKAGKRFDAKAFEAADPATYAKYLTETAASRRLLVK